MILLLPVSLSVIVSLLGIMVIVKVILARVERLPDFVVVVPTAPAPFKWRRASFWIGMFILLVISANLLSC